MHRAFGITAGQFLQHRPDRTKADGQSLSQPFTIAGQGQRTTRPVQQGDIQVTLKRAKMLADRRVGHIQRRARADHIAGFGKSGERAQRRKRWHVTPVHM